VVLVAAVVTLLVLLGGSGGTTSVGSSTRVAESESSPQESQAGIPLLLLVRQDERICGGLLLQSRGDQGVVIGVPGISLLRSGDRFVTLAELAGSRPSGATAAGGAAMGLGNAVGEVSGLSTVAVACAEWPDLLARLEGEGFFASPQRMLLGTLLRSLDPEGADSGQAALAVGGWLTLLREAGRADPWEGLSLQGEVDRFRSASRLLSRVGSWSYGVVTGKLQGGEGARYLDPALGPVRDMLAKAAGKPLARVQVQNGSGLVGVAEQAAETLAGLGFELLPVRNALGFPDVVETRIVAAPDVEMQSLVIREVLGLGNLSTEGSLAGGSIVVIMGQDYQVGRRD